MMKRLLFIVGLVALLMGLLWVGQGTGVVPYPAESFMISDIKWAYYGAALAIVGFALAIYARRT